MDKILFRKTGLMVYPPIALMKRGLEALKLYFVIKINVVLLKKEMGANVDLKGEAPTVGTVRRISEVWNDLGEHVVLFMKVGCSSVMFVESISEEGSTW